jgi:hypothetical protein
MVAADLELTGNGSTSERFGNPTKRYNFCLQTGGSKHANPEEIPD